MSYDITNFKLKELENLQIPLDSFFKHESEDWHPCVDIGDGSDGSIILSIMDTEIIGTIKGESGIILISDIYCSGEGSGTIMDEILEPALEDSTGELIASLVWEGGDTINQLIVKDGKVSFKDIEI